MSFTERQYKIPLGAPNPSGRYKEVYYLSSNTSPRNSEGELVLRSNAHTFRHSRVLSASAPDGYIYPYTAEQLAHPGTTEEQRNLVYGRFMAKLRDQDADLGVSFASWRQSRDMIASRLQQLHRAFGDRPHRRPARHSRMLRQKAGDVLEWNFGWVPLVSDIHSAAQVVTDPKILSGWVSSSGYFTHLVNTRVGTNPVSTTHEVGRVRLSYGAKVSVENKNLWLANRLGLINPLTVAWDLVPWSFVINMFVNVNQVLSSLTDTVGLTITDVSRTESSVILTNGRTWWTEPPWEGWTSQSECLHKYRSRTVGGSIPRPSFDFRVPDFSWQTAVNASALLVQRLRFLR